MADTPRAGQSEHSSSPTPAVRLEIPLRTIVRVLAAIAAAWLLVQLWAVVLVVVFALVLVGTLNPLVCRLVRRGWRRGLAILVIAGGLLLAASLLLLLTLPPLIAQAWELVESLPEQRERLIAWLQARPLTAPLAGMVRESGSGEAVAAIGEALLTYSSEAVKTITYVLTSLMLAFYILADIDRARGGLFAVVPRSHHMRLARILLELQTIVGGYVRGQLITSATITLFTLALLSACQVPNALPLAVFAGLTDVIPFVGGLLATAPAALGALAVSPTTALIVLGTMVLYQELESRVLVPRLYGKVLRLSAATVILALLIGGSLLGIAGALLALPISAGLLMVLRELRVELPGDDSEDLESRAREARVERTYERRSAGVAPQEAALIATELARADDATAVAARIAGAT